MVLEFFRLNSNTKTEKEKLKKWQKLVAEDDSKEIMVMKGRRVGATTLAPYLSKGCNLMYVTLNYSYMKNGHDQCFSYIKEHNELRLIEHDNWRISYKYNGKENKIYFATLENMIDKMCSKLIDKIVFDEIYKYQVEPSELNNIKEVVEQIYYFVSPSLVEESFYVVPSVGIIDERNITEMKKMIDPDVFREEILAGVIFDKELNEKEMNIFINYDKEIINLKPRS